jgi:hypothetical protein
MVKKEHPGTINTKIKGQKVVQKYKSRVTTYFYKHPLDGETCIVCGSDRFVNGHHCWQKVNGKTSWRKRTEDWRMIPLCRKHHSLLHGFNHKPVPHIENILWQAFIMRLISKHNEKETK